MLQAELVLELAGGAGAVSARAGAAAKAGAWKVVLTALLHCTVYCGRLDCGCATGWRRRGRRPRRTGRRGHTAFRPSLSER